MDQDVLEPAILSGIMLRGDTEENKAEAVNPEVHGTKYVPPVQDPGPLDIKWTCVLYHHIISFKLSLPPTLLA